MPTKGFDAIIGSTGDDDDPEPRGATDNAHIAELQARNAALWAVAEAAISFAGIDEALGADNTNPMLWRSWYAAIARVRAAVKAYQEAQQ